MGYLIVSI